MKKFTSLILVTVMAFMAVFMTSCDFDTSTAPDPEPAESTSESSDTSDNTQSDTPIKVADVNGLDVKGLYEKYKKLCLEMKNFEVTSVTTELYDGVETKTNMTAKFGSDGKIYFKITEDSDTSEFWISDNEAYFNMGELKFRIINFKLSDFISDNIDNILSGIDAKKLESASLYKLGESYYFSIELSADEALEMGYEDEAHTATFYFDSNGNVTKTVVVSKSLNETETYSNVGNNITVSMPKNTTDYETIDYDELFGDDSVLYAVYDSVFEAVQNAKYYHSEATVEEKGKSSTSLVYGIDMTGNQLCVAYTSEGEYSIRKKVNGDIYISENGEKEEKVSEGLSELETTLANAAKIKSTFLAFKLDEESITYIDLEYDTEVEMYNLVVCSDDVLFGFLFNEDMTYVQVEIETGNSSLSYTFSEINNKSLTY